MSSIISTRVSLEIKDINPTQALQTGASLNERAFYKISDSGRYIIQSINNVAQLILSKCIYVVSFGRYNLDSLKNYLFSNQTALESNKLISTNNLPNRPEPPPPPPPPMPPLRDLNRASFSRSSSANISNESLDIRSSVNSIRGFPQEDNTYSRRSSLHEDSNPVIEEQIQRNPIVNSSKKEKIFQQKIGSLFANMPSNSLFQRKQRELN